MEIDGHVEGAIGGVSTELKIKGRYKFHRGHKRITWFAMLIEEKSARSAMSAREPMWWPS